MRLSAEKKREIHERILKGAGRLFRAEGYEGVSLDDVMQAAGLTRGAFYAHFKSKADLFREVVRAERPMLRMLRERPGPDADALWDQMLALVAGYLDPKNLEAVYAGCTAAALTGDAARAPEPVRAAYEAAFADMLDEIARSQEGADRQLLAAALTLASGAVNTAASCADAAARRQVLAAAWKGVSELLRLARGPAAGDDRKNGATD